MRLSWRVPLAATLVALLAGCTGVGPRPDYDPGVTAADFVDGISNEWLPLVAGAFWVYEGGGERIEVRVLDETRDVNGVAATVVRDTVTEDGALVEDTYDWFAQDRGGNVWYLGEDTCEYEDGTCVSTEGAWEWGVDGALPGIVMWADPQPGDPYFQEFYWPEAIDEARVLRRGDTATVPAGTFTGAVVTDEWTRLHPDVHELAFYARGVGLVLKGEVEDLDAGGGERLVEYAVPA